MNAFRKLRAGLCGFALFTTSLNTFAGGVTIITHGLNSDIDDWVIAMANRIIQYPLFPGVSSTCYEIYFVPSGTGYTTAWRRLGGGLPTATDSGEILIKLDWRQLANDAYSTYQIAAAIAPRLLDPSFISELNGQDRKSVV